MISCFGTVYRVHPLFVLMMAMSVFTGYYVELLVLFGIVVIHELGHAAAAWMCGWKVTEIQLLPFGGVAVVEEAAEATAWQEISVALAGPLQNGLMIAAAYALTSFGFWDEAWAHYFIQANVSIALFNLIPVLPLDGGRIMQALLSKRYAYFHTLLASSWFSFALSAALILYSLLQFPYRSLHLNLLVIAVFLLVSNGYAIRDVYYRFIRFLVHREKRTATLLRTGGFSQPIVVGEAYEPVEVAKLLKREQYHLIYVVNGRGRIATVVPEHRLIRDMFSGGHSMIEYKEMSGSAGVER